MSQKKITFIGAGNMATAIIRGISRSEKKKDYLLTAYDTILEKAESLKEYGVIAAREVEPAVASADFLFLAVQPQNFAEVLATIKPFVRERTVVVSIAAGITSGYLKSMLFDTCKAVSYTHLVRQLIFDGVTELLSKYDVDGIHIDDYFYPTTDSGFDQTAFQTFAAGKNLSDWRKSNVDETVSGIYYAVKAVKTEVVFGVSAAGKDVYKRQPP